MSQWKMVHNAVNDIARGNAANWVNLVNTVAEAYNTALMYGGTFNANVVTVADFVNMGVSLHNANFYTRKALTGVAFTSAGFFGKPFMDCDDVNIVVSGGTCDANFVAIFQNYPGSTDSDRNVVLIGDLGAQSIASGTNLVLQMSATNGILQADDPNT